MCRENNDSFTIKLERRHSSQLGEPVISSAGWMDPALFMKPPPGVTRPGFVLADNPDADICPLFSGTLTIWVLLWISPF